MKTLTKYIKYNQAIKQLQNNDHNATYDEIFQDYDSNIDNAHKCLKSTLERIIEELTSDEMNKFDKVEQSFYINILKSL